MKKFTIAVLAAGAVLSASSAMGAAPRDAMASPRSLPTDGLPPFGMLDDSGKLIPLPEPRIPAAPPRAAQPEQPKAVPTRGLSLDLATEAVRTAIDTCGKQGLLIAAAVVDAQGKPQAMMAAEGTGGSVFVSMRKAAAALEFKLPSSSVGAAIANDKAMLARMTPVMFVAGGALPIWRGNELIGAIAASGAAGGGPIGAKDELCAKAGLDRIAGRIN